MPLYKDHFRHILAIGVPTKAFINLKLFGHWGGSINVVPKPDCAVGGTCCKLGQVIIRLTLFHSLDAEVADLLVVLDGLDVVNGAAVGHEGAVDCYLVEFLYVPNEHHSI